VDELISRASAGEELMLMVGDLGFGVVEKFSSRFPNQFLNAGVAEQNMTGMAAGIASDGTRVFTYSIANFPTMRALEQVRNDICYHSFPVTIVAVGSGVDYGTLGYSHFAVEDISVMRSLPNLVVYSPADEVELRLIMGSIFSSKAPSYVRISKNSQTDLPILGNWRQIDRPRKISEGFSKLLVLSTGSISKNVLAAYNLISERLPSGLDMYSVPQVSPIGLAGLDWDKYGSVLTVEEHVLPGGFGSAVLEYLSEHKLRLPVERIGLSFPEQLPTGSSDHLHKTSGLDEFSLAATIMRVFEASKPQSTN
jgi:transketolase